MFDLGLTTFFNFFLFQNCAVLVLYSVLFTWPVRLLIPFWYRPSVIPAAWGCGLAV
jgi:hypothetical protein